MANPVLRGAVMIGANSLLLSYFMPDSRVMTPWFAPRLSSYATRVVLQLGHCIPGRRGSVVVGEESRVSSLLFVKNGLVARALVHPGRSQPLVWSLSLPGSLCGGCQNLYSGDHLPRRHWTLRDSEVLEVPQELLLKIADRDVALHRELAAYCERSAMCDKLGLLVGHLAANADRLQIFLASALLAAGHDLHGSLGEESHLRLPPLPRREVVAQVVACSPAVVDRVLTEWIQSGDLKRGDGALWISRERALHSYHWLQQLLDSTSVT
ncbi:MAG: hypothetical protein RRY41_10850 [Burkholderiaceae bacterium]